METPTTKNLVRADRKLAKLVAISKEKGTPESFRAMMAYRLSEEYQSLYSLDEDFLDALSIFKLLSFKLKRLNKNHPIYVKDLIKCFEDILNEGFLDEL